MSSTVIVGFAAAFCSTVAFVPQALKAWRTRSTQDVSLITFLTIIIGCVLWMIYAWLRGDVAVFATNAIIFVLASGILGLKIRYG